MSIPIKQKQPTSNKPYQIDVLLSTKTSNKTKQKSTMTTSPKGKVLP